MAAATEERLHLAAAHPRGEVLRPGFRGLTYVVAGLTVMLVLYIVATIGHSAAPAIRERGLGFLTETTWDPNKEPYGILPQIWGTLYSSVLAVVIGTVFGLAVAVFLSERCSPRLSFAS